MIIEQALIDINSFYTELDIKCNNAVKLLTLKISEFQNNPEHPLFLRWLNNTWNKKEYWHIYDVTKKFCEKYKIDFRKEIGSWNGVSLSKIQKGRTYGNHPNSYNIIKNLVKFQCLYLAEKLPSTSEQWQIIPSIVTINTMMEFCQVGKLLSEPSYIDSSKFSFYFWNSIKIKNLISDVEEELKQGNKTIFNYKGDLVMGEEKHTFLEMIGVSRPELTKEWIESVIGNETSYSKAIKMIMEKEPSYSRRKIQWALEKTGIDKRLVKRQYGKKDTSDNNSNIIQLPKNFGKKPFNAQCILDLFNGYENLTQGEKINLLMERYGYSRSSAVRDLKKFGLYENKWGKEVIAQEEPVEDEVSILNEKRIILKEENQKLREENQKLLAAQTKNSVDIKEDFSSISTISTNKTSIFSDEDFEWAEK